MIGRHELFMHLCLQKGIDLPDNNHRYMQPNEAFLTWVEKQPKKVKKSVDEVEDEKYKDVIK